ncbi:major facilitator superfamily domain-containing protein [Multifurca ochricompacta]|uniref:Major facilitator superfamily domain-containing protein n=1 Tax=Multifurca ochricompacta TaxID=376703 RepID=A0AAD4M776_9AGAM|nr:major facilitator superfamily domain-containing protein [Multifurca ochricompacta]
MHGSGVAPGLFSLTRFTTLSSSILVSLSSGSNYVRHFVLAYLPQLGSRLHLSHTQLNVFAVAGNVGMYTSGPFWGPVVDARGPRPLLVAAFILLLSGYSGIRGLFDAGLGNAAELSQLRLVILIMCSFLTGVGGNAGMSSAVNVTAKSFPDYFRAIVVGLVMSGFGLSAFFFSSISHVLFPGNTSDFLFVLGLGTALPMVLGFFFVRPVPLPSKAIGSGPLDNYQPLSAPTDSVVYPVHASSSTPLLFESEEDEEVEPPTIHLSGSVELSTSPSFQNRNRTPSEKIVEGRGVELHRWTLWKSIDFWIMCSIHILYINNVGSIAQALFAHGNSAYDEADSSAWQAAQVSVLSLANCFGRILIGIAADTAKSRIRVPRSFCMPVVSALFILALLLLIVMDDVRHLWAASGLIGLAYGCWFGLLPTVSIEWFGLAHFSENWGIISVFPVVGGNLFSLAFGHNLDAHELPALQPASAHQCMAGRECYVRSLYLNLGACMVALGLSVWAGRRDWSDWQRRQQHRERMNVPEWVAAGKPLGQKI